MRESMELSKYEAALIESLREAEVVPGNLVLWFVVKKRENAEQIKDINPNAAQEDIRQADTIEAEYIKRTN